MTIADIALGERILGSSQEREIWSQLIEVKILALSLLFPHLYNGDGNCGPTS